MKRKNKFDTLPGNSSFNIEKFLSLMCISGLGPYKPNQYPIQSQSQHPYSYSPFIVWGEEKDNETVQYSDRLYQQNFELTEKLCKTHFGDRGQHFNNRNPELIESFLKERLDRPNLKLHMIVEWCNVSNGYPYWSFHFTA